MTVERKREAVGFLQAKEVSQRRSCQLIFLARSTCQYRIKRKPDEAFETQVKELAFAHPRYGYRRVHALLRRGGQRVNEKRVMRVWQKFGLQVPRLREKKKRRREPQLVMPQASRPNEVWTYDFMFDRDAAGRRLKLLTLMDEFTREGLAIRVGRSFKAAQVKEVLREVGAKHGYPQFLRSDNGAEFIAGHVKEFLVENQIKAAYIEPGSPWQNGKGESFNGKFRDECLRMEIFGNWREAAVVSERWRTFYNSARPHSSLGYQTPKEFKLEWDKRQRTLKAETMKILAIPMAQSWGS
ncbi:MAG: IS3 family transposase [Pyrinomonadaceae bacterium MAG19_C2-C3]|nr:IS3 family transposase [Pyrinomonadaceae bacterium MAG19_C2-C3]